MLDPRSPAFTQRLEIYKRQYLTFMALSAELTHRRLKSPEQKLYRALRREFDKLTRSNKKDDKQFLDLAFRISSLLQ
jgi:hypothetical protein